MSCEAWCGAGSVLKNMLKVNESTDFGQLLVQGVGSPPRTVTVTEKLLAPPLTPTLEGADVDRSRGGEQKLRA